jgi:hypothetical protein
MSFLELMTDEPEALILAIIALIAAMAFIFSFHFTNN